MAINANAAADNVAGAISFCQTQDGYLQKVGDALNRMSIMTPGLPAARRIQFPAAFQNRFGVPPRAARRQFSFSR